MTPGSPRLAPGADSLLLGSVIRTLAHTVSAGWHCFGAQWLELVVSVQSWHHRPWAGGGRRRRLTRGTKGQARPLQLQALQ